MLSIKGDSNEDSNPSIRLKDGTDTREAWITNNSGDLMLANGGDDNVYHARIRLMDGKAINFDIDGSYALNIDSSRNATFVGTVSDSIGNLRSIVYTSKTSAHTLVASDAGKLVYISTGGVTLPNNVMSGGDAITIINNSGSDQTLTQASGLTLYNTADGSTGNRTLAGRGMATVWYHGGSTAYISGAGLS